MTIVQHTIQQLQFDLEIKNEKRALKIQNELSSLARIDLPGIIENIFSSVDKQEFVHIFEKMEIDLGEIKAEDFKNDFISRFKIQLSEQLASLSRDDRKQPEGIKIHPAKPGSIEILKYYLQFGTLPWYLENQSINLDLELESIIARGDVSFFQFIEEKLVDLFIRDRIIYSFSEENILLLAKELLGEKFITLAVLISQAADLLPILKSDTKPSDFEIKYIKLTALLQTISLQKKLPSFSMEEIYFSEFGKLLYSSLDNFIKAIQSLIVDQSITDTKRTPASEKIILNKEIVILKEWLEISSHIPNIKNENISEEVIAKKKALLKEITEYYISNGGIILLHPFLPQLFKKLKLVVDDDFPDKYSYHKAMHLLQYAVFGNQNRPEHIMVLNKVLCGYPLDEPIPHHITISTHEKAETTNMIKAAIKHWVGLGNTSVDGFKVSFLQRNALLKENEKTWELSLERKAFDMLLDQIPWNYNLIKLPWMEKLLEVKW